MFRRPRLAFSHPANGSEPSIATLAVLAALTERGLRVQHFRCRASLTEHGVVDQATGFPSRHLDAWLMPPDVCRGVFLRGARHADLAVVDGTFGRPQSEADPTETDNRPGPLCEIAGVLNLPMIAVVPCKGPSDLHLPHRHRGINAVLLDGLEDPRDYGRVKGVVEALWQRPVIGAVEAMPDERAAICLAQRDRRLLPGVLERLAESFRRFADIDALSNLANRAPFDCPAQEFIDEPRRRLRVAYALDEAFGGYYPDSLETLESLGAELIEFSPLRDESLPEGADLVLIGCGVPERFCDALTRNQSLMVDLRGHVCRGGRLYAEGGGAAYLSRSIQAQGRSFPGVGIFPFDVELISERANPTPHRCTLAGDSWLGGVGTEVRGYHAGRWRFHPANDHPLDGHCPKRAGALTEGKEIVFRHKAVGSLIHLHLAALPEVLRAFVGLPSSSSIASTRRLP